MKKMGKLAVLATITTSLFVGSVAQAHGIWFAQRSTQLALLYGVGADDLDIVKRASQVTSTSAYDGAGKPVQTSVQQDGRLMLVDTSNQPAVVAATLDNGTWSKTPDGRWHKKGKDEVPTAVVSEHTYKYAVHLRAPLSAPLGAIPGHTLQVVPVAAALPPMLGDPITLRVLYKGKPVAGARVLHDWVNDPDGKPVLSGVDGTVTLKVRNQGLNVIVAIFDAAPDEPAKYNKTEHLASLSFVLPHAPE
jgi:nickel transport protein